MASSVLVPLQEYLATSYQPDRDSVDGELKERDMGEQPHAAVQGIIARIFGTRRIEWGIRVLPEQCVQVSKTRYRIADVCILRRSDPKDRIVNWAPLLCIEVLSEEDRLQELQTKVNEFEALGTRDIWVDRSVEARRLLCLLQRLPAGDRRPAARPGNSHRAFSDGVIC